MDNVVVMNQQKHDQLPILDHDRYCVAYEECLSQLERALYHLKNPEDIIMGTLEALCAFYQADWSGGGN